MEAAAAVHPFGASGPRPARDRSVDSVPTTPRRRFEDLLARHETMLRRVALGMLGDPSRVDDVLQEVLLKAFLKLPARFESDRQEAVWLYRVVHRCCLDEIRRRRRRPETVAEMREAAVGHELDDSLAVTAALAELPPNARAVVLLVDLLGFEYEAAAETLGIPRGTVASRLNAARRRFREALDA
ncbi:MAG TPA: RNA polymerase sigma factor [Gaiellaceae bacterium]|nr:RNA polymerase sigma factor [Gaiellaceae bacterium]